MTRDQQKRALDGDAMRDAPKARAVEFEGGSNPFGAPAWCSCCFEPATLGEACP